MASSLSEAQKLSSLIATIRSEREQLDRGLDPSKGTGVGYLTHNVNGRRSSPVEREGRPGNRPHRGGTAGVAVAG
jgi:hypothetical protein